MANPDTRPDAELLRQYCEEGASTAFEVLVRRYADMVCGVARRVTGRHELAEEVMQNVFLRLAHKARSLIGRGGRLAGWLHRATVFESKHLLRGERRHERRMRVAGEQQEIVDANEGRDGALRGEIDDVLNSLAPADRELLVCRYYKGMTYPEIAQQSGKSEAAVRKQGQRALEKLGKRLRGAGVVAPAAALASFLGSGMGEAASPALVASVLAKVSNAGSAGGGLLALTKLKLAAPALGATALVATIFYQGRVLAKLPDERGRAEGVAASSVVGEPIGGGVTAIDGPLVSIEKRYSTAEEVDLVALADDLYHGDVLSDHERLMRALGTFVDLESLPTDEMKKLMELALVERLSPTRRKHLLGHLATLVAGRDPHWLFDRILVPSRESGRGRVSGLQGYFFESPVTVAANVWAEKDVRGALRWFEQALDEGRFGTSGASMSPSISSPILALGWAADRPQVERVVLALPDRERESSLAGVPKRLPRSELLSFANWSELGASRVRGARGSLVHGYGERFKDGEWAEVEEFAEGLNGEGVEPREFLGAAAASRWRFKRGQVAQQLEEYMDKVDSEHLAYMIGTALGAWRNRFPTGVMWGHAKRIAEEGEGEEVIAAYLERSGRPWDKKLKQAASELSDPELKADVATTILYRNWDSGRRRGPLRFERDLERAGFSVEEIEMVRRSLEGP